MNERLKELYIQAHTTRHYDGDPALDGNPPTVYWQGEVSAQRFAELIIKECVNCIDNTDNDMVFTAQSAGVVIAAHNRSIEKIKKHFGVK